MISDQEINKVVWSQDVLLRCIDVARILNISRSKVYMLIQSGDLVSVRIDSSVRVRPSDLQTFITERLSRETRKGF